MISFSWVKVRPGQQAFQVSISLRLLLLQGLHGVSLTEEAFCSAEFAKLYELNHHLFEDFEITIYFTQNVVPAPLLTSPKWWWTNSNWKKYPVIPVHTSWWVSYQVISGTVQLARRCPNGPGWCRWWSSPQSRRCSEKQTSLLEECAAFCSGCSPSGIAGLVVSHWKNKRFNFYTAFHCVVTLFFNFYLLSFTSPDREKQDCIKTLVLR